MPLTPVRWALRVLLASCAVLAACALLVLTGPGQRADQALLDAVRLPWPRSIPVFHVVGPLTPRTVAVVLVLGVATALLRRRLDLAVAAATAIVGANALATALKASLPRPAHGVVGALTLDNISPSGHTAAAASFAIALVLVAPDVLRLPAVALASAGTTAAGVGMLIVGMHRPGDVVAAVAVALAVAAVAVVVAAIVRRRAPRACGGRENLLLQTPLPGALTGVPVTAAAAGAGAVFVVVRYWVYGVVVPGGVAGAAGVAAVAALAACAVVLTVVVADGVRRFLDA